jgi:hypothetical protein
VISNVTALLRAIVAGAAAAALSAAALAQAPNYNGTFQLNKTASQIAAGVGLDGLGAAGAPTALYVTHAANGSLTIESNVNESAARVYKPGAPSVFTVTRGEPITVKARWDGATMVAEGDSLKEVISLSPDGQTLTIAVTKGEATTTLSYGRVQSAGPCKSWPTPCR